MKGKDTKMDPCPVNSAKPYRTCLDLDEVGR